MHYILDTDALTILHRRSNPGFIRLTQRLAVIPTDHVVTTVVNCEEQMRGWLAAVHRSRGEAKLLTAYAELAQLFEEACQMTLLPFDASAQRVFTGLQRQRVRIGTMDLRIASIALSRQMTLVTGNLRDFEQVPGLLAEDWTV